MAERAEELRQQLDDQRADISRTVEEIENRVVPGRVFNRRKYRMRRSMMDWRDRLMGNEEQDYPAHWYAQPAAPMGPGYAQTAGQEYGQGTQYTFQGGDEGSRVGEARDRASGAMHQATDRASGAAHQVSDRASGAAHQVSDRASGAMYQASGAMHQVGDRLGEAPQVMRRQTQGNPLALGLVTFGAGVLVASLLPESQKEQQLARQAEPQMQKAVEGGKGVAADVAADLREAAQGSAEELKQTAAQEAQAFKGEATQEAQATRSDAEKAVRE